MGEVWVGIPRELKSQELSAFAQQFEATSWPRRFWQETQGDVEVTFVCVPAESVSAAKAAVCKVLPEFSPDDLAALDRPAFLRRSGVEPERRR